jgi:hypothetical protein
VNTIKIIFGSNELMARPPYQLKLDSTTAASALAPRLRVACRTIAKISQLFTKASIRAAYRGDS